MKIDYIKDSNDQGFTKDVIDESQIRPVIVDFWAPWCQPCLKLTPVLEKLVEEQKGKIALVKINIEQNQMIASTLQVQSIPLVLGFLKARPLDGIAGLQPDKVLKDFINSLLVAAKQAGMQLEEEGTDEEDLEKALQHAHHCLEKNNISEAISLYQQLLQSDQANLPALAGLARSYLIDGQKEQAEMLLTGLDDESIAHADVSSVLVAIDFKNDVAALVAALAKKKVNEDQKVGQIFNKAIELLISGKEDEGIENLLLSLEQDHNWQDKIHHKLILKWLEGQGARSSKVHEVRRRLARILFS